MTTILQILVSPRAQSHSRRVAGDVTRRIAGLVSDARIIERDLAANSPPHPEIDLYDAILSPTPDDDPRFAYSEALIRELEAADYVVIGTPMNNFTVPSTLKAWIDHIVRIRRTFRSTPEGKVGLLSDRLVIIVTSHGGYRGETPPGQPDFLSPYLRTIFETIGIGSVEFLPLESLARGTDALARAMNQATAFIERRVPELIPQRVSPTNPR
ncbi:MAG: NAD(P)H-dependent oxidoreductase [Alphaproteobacteria bacterium]|nr:NAD(P)H-dependent oxidoreductase [Alphaproteobacteria bacterium]